jgi:O-antigen ligase
VAASIDPEPPPVAIVRREPRDFAFLGLLAFTAVLFFRPQDLIPALRVLHLAEVTALVALIALIAQRLGKGLPVSRFVPELAGVIALGAIILVMSPFSVWMGGVIATFTELYVKVLLIFVLMVNTLTSARRIEQLCWIIVTALGYIACRAVFDYVRGDNLIEYGRVQGSVGGIFKNPNDLALNLVASIPIAVALAVRSASVSRRILVGVCIFFMLAAMVATRSRSGALALVVMGCVLAVRLFPRNPGTVCAGVLAVMMAVPFLPQSYYDRLVSISNAEMDDTGSREARQVVFGEGVAAFLAHPLTGVGAGQFKNYNPDGRVEAWRETHNVVLQVASELGVAGLLCFGFLIARAFLAPLQTARLLRRFSGRGRNARDSLAMPESERAAFAIHQIAMSASVAGWFVCALFGSVAYNWTFYYLLGLAIAPREILLDRIRVQVRLRRGSGTVLAAAGAR